MTLAPVLHTIGAVPPACVQAFLGIRAAAAPIFDANGDVSAAVSSTGVTLSVEEMTVINSVKAAAPEISRSFSGATQIRKS